MAAAYSAALERGFAPTMPLPRGSVTYYWLQRAAARATEGANLADELGVDQFFTDTYQFRAALRQRALLEPLRAFHAAGGILIGVSAGAILLTPTMHTAALCGDAPPADGSDCTGLALIPFAFLPHSNQLPNADAIIRSYTAQHRQPLIACPDGSGVIIDGATTTLIGHARAVAPFRSSIA